MIKIFVDFWLAIPYYAFVDDENTNQEDQIMKREYDVWYWDVAEGRRRSTVVIAKSYGEAREKLDEELFAKGITASQIEIEEGLWARERE